MKKKLMSIVLVASFLLPVCMLQARAESGNVLKQTTGVVLGLVVGPVVGAM